MLLIAVLSYLYVNPRPAGIFGRTRPAGGGGRFCSLSNFPTNGRRKTEKRQTKALNKTNLRKIKNLLKEVRGQVRVRSKVKATGFNNYGFRAQLMQC